MSDYSMEERVRLFMESLESRKEDTTTPYIQNATDTSNVLTERGNSYGDYADVATTSQILKNAMYSTVVQIPLEPYMKESLEMIANKISRILNGDPCYIDSWRDIAGYAELVVQKLHQHPEASDCSVTKYKLAQVPKNTAPRDN